MLEGGGTPIPAVITAGHRWDCWARAPGKLWFLAAIGVLRLLVQSPRRPDSSLRMTGYKGLRLDIDRIVGRRRLVILTILVFVRRRSGHGDAHVNEAQRVGILAHHHLARKRPKRGGQRILVPNVQPVAAGRDGGDRELALFVGDGEV